MYQIKRKVKYRISQIGMFGICLASAWSSTARASLSYQGADDEGNPDPVFQQHVRDCIEKIRSTPSGAALIESLEDPESHKVLITKSKDWNWTASDSDYAARSRDAGGSGAGSGSTIHWDPDSQGKYADGSTKDPCATLLHELTHALIASQGRSDPDVPPNPSREEVDAQREENRYRDAVGIDQRTEGLPPDAVHPK